MRRPINAALVAMICAMLPLLEWLSAATVALVTMRKGWQQGLFIMLWAGLSGGVRWAYGDLLTLPMLVTVFSGALILRQTVSLSYAIITVTALSVVMMGFFQKVMPSGFDALIEKTSSMLQEMQFFEKLEITGPEQWVMDFTLAGFGFSLAIASLFGLFIGRWWQAGLFNPGGFQEEFHQLRLPPITILLLVGVGYLIGAFVPQLSFAGVLLTIPILLNGIALVHSLAKLYGLGRQVLIPFYVLLVIFNGYLYLLLIMVVIADSFLNIRQRVAESRQ